MRKFITALGLTAALGMGTAGGCDPGDQNGGGETQHVMIAISPGTYKITKAYYGLWHPSKSAKSSCKWTITKNGKTIGSGGKFDLILIGTAARDGFVTIGSACGKVTK